MKAFRSCPTFKACNVRCSWYAQNYLNCDWGRQGETATSSFLTTQRSGYGIGSHISVLSERYWQRKSWLCMLWNPGATELASWQQRRPKKTFQSNCSPLNNPSERPSSSPPSAPPNHSVTMYSISRSPSTLVLLFQNTRSHWDMGSWRKSTTFSRRTPKADQRLSPYSLFLRFLLQCQSCLERYV